MNHERIASLRKSLDEIDAVVSNRLKNMTAVELAQAAQECIDDPVKTIFNMMSSKASVEAGSALVACTIIREAIRKAEAEEMEK